MKNPATRARSGSSVSSVPSTSGRSSRLSPASWAVIITAVSAVVARSPNSAQPDQSISDPVELVLLGAEHLEHALVGTSELLDSLLLQHQAYLVEVDAEVGELTHHLARLCYAGVDGATHD